MLKVLREPHKTIKYGSDEAQQLDPTEHIEHTDEMYSYESRAVDNKHEHDGTQTEPSPCSSPSKNKLITFCLHGVPSRFSRKLS